MKLDGIFNADLCVWKMYGVLLSYVSIHISFFYFVCITTLCFTESLVMHHLACTQESDRVRHLRHVAHDAQNVIIRGARLLLCRHVLMQIRDRIALRLEFAGVKRNAARCLRPDGNGVIDIIRTKPGILNLLHRQVSGELVNDRSNHFKVRQFIRSALMDISAFLLV